jgi:serine phosphatase RsbU (regulator of sigma subunit)
MGTITDKTFNSKEFDQLLEKKNREIKVLAKELILQKEEINIKKEIIENQRDGAFRQRDEIVIQQKEMTSSFTYASRIQSAMLTSSVLFEKHLKDHFILYKPRNIVSGDFYWMTEEQGKLIITAADATGHGVPGAFMSLIVIVFLNDIVNSMHIIEPSEILELMRQKIISVFIHEGKETVDAGMDMALISLDKQEMKLKFSGAFNPAIIIRNKQVIELEAEKMPIGYHPYLMSKKFSNREFDIKNGDRIYLFSDGFIDQFGWRNNKKFMKRKFKSFLIDIQSVPMKGQKLLLENNFNNWKGDLEQVDDIVILGIEV